MSMEWKPLEGRGVARISPCVASMHGDAWLALEPESHPMIVSWVKVSSTPRMVLLAGVVGSGGLSPG